MSVCEGCGTPLESPTGRRKWCSQKCRRTTTYVRHCLDCGKRLNSSDGNGPSASKRCRPCSNAANTIWTREAIIVAIRTWAAESGGIPPSATDWNPSHAQAVGHPEKAEKFYADDAWPWVDTVQTRFGSWAAAIRAAGLVPRPTGMYGREGEDPALCAEIRARYEAGGASVALAREYDVSPSTVTYRIRKAGGTNTFAKGGPVAPPPQHFREGSGMNRVTWFDVLALTGALCWASALMWVGCFACSYARDVWRCRHAGRRKVTLASGHTVTITTPRPAVAPIPDVSLEVEWRAFVRSLPEVRS